MRHAVRHLSGWWLADEISGPHGYVLHWNDYRVVPADAAVGEHNQGNIQADRI